MEYQEVFSRVYQQEWGAPPTMLAASILRRLGNMPVRTALDVCCGTGHLARELAGKGIRVTGIDLSPAMIARAKEQRGKLPIRYLRADATKFNLSARFDLVTSTYDSLNHLRSIAGLKACFKRCHRHLHPGGHFIFDLNTEKALKEVWDRSSKTIDKDGLFLQMRGSYLPKEKRSFTRINGFIRKGRGSLYERFDEKIFNTAFPMKRTLAALKEAGFTQVGCYGSSRLDTLLNAGALEKQHRVFFVCGKP